MSERGIDTDKYHVFRAKLNDVELRMVEKVKKHYGFKSETELFIALIKRAFMHITIKS